MVWVLGLAGVLLACLIWQLERIASALEDLIRDGIPPWKDDRDDD